MCVIGETHFTTGCYSINIISDNISNWASDTVSLWSRMHNHWWQSPYCSLHAPTRQAESLPLSLNAEHGDFEGPRGVWGLWRVHSSLKIKPLSIKKQQICLMYDSLQSIRCITNFSPGAAASTRRKVPHELYKAGLTAAAENNRAVQFQLSKSKSAAVWK